MRRLSLITAAAFLLAVAFPFTSHAQMDSESSFKLGPRATISIGDISDAYGGDFALGADARYMTADFPVTGAASFDFYLADENVSVYSIDLNALYPIEASEGFAPYVGAGLGYTNISFDTDNQFGGFSGSDTGLNLVGGAEFPVSGSFTPFAQAQFTLGDLDRFGITGGLLFNL